MRRFRPYLALALVALLSFAGIGMALARTAPDPSGQIVLCIGTGPVKVFTDADGNPVGPPHFCPDCAFQLLVAIDAPDVDLPDLPRAVQSVDARQEPHRRAMARVVRARGPPFVV